MNKFFMTDSGGNKSATLTAFAIGFIVVNVKLILSGMTIGGITLAPFSGSEYAMAIGSLGAIYTLRRATMPKVEDKK